MSATGRPESAAARAVESAGFVHVVTRADGDGLAAAGVLARALSGRDTPFQVSVARTVAERTARLDDRDGDDVETVAIGPTDRPESDSIRLETDDRPASLAAADLVAALADGPGPDRVLALAGAVAAGVDPREERLAERREAATERGAVERRPGVAVPTGDVADGLAHSTLVRGPWSGDVEAARDLVADATGDAALADLDDPAAARERIGSVVAIDAVAAGSERAATAIERVLRPAVAPAAPFETVGGYADVLEATARTRPGTGLAVALGHDVREAALSAWREHGRRVHGALDDAATSRYDGLYVCSVGDAPVASVARVAAAFESPEPVVLAIGDGEAGLAAADGRSLAAPAEGIARELGHERASDAGVGRATVEFDPSTDDATLVRTAREYL